MPKKLIERKSQDTFKLKIGKETSLLVVSVLQEADHRVL